MNFTKKNHRRVVSVVSILIAYHIDIQIVSVLQFITIGDPMGHHIIDRGAHAFSELVESYRGRICIILNYEIVDNLINIVKCHPYLSLVQRLFQGSGPQIGCIFQALNLIFVHHVNWVHHYVGEHLRILVHVRGSYDMWRHVPRSCNFVLID